jgi:hypothetical protein
MACVASLENAKNDMAQTPNPTVERTCAKSRAGRSLPRWGAQGMRQFAPSHLQPLALSPMRLVLPVRKVGALPSLPHTRQFATACAFCWRPRRVAPVEAPAQVRATRGNTSACVLGRGSVASVARPLLLGRLAGVTQVRRVPSSAHRGRRIASADSCATRVVCGGRAFVSRFRSTPSALALARLVPASPVNRSAPTHRSSGAAPKAAQPAQLKRWAFPNIQAVGLHTPD